jgi:hypothetical protein
VDRDISDDQELIGVVGAHVVAHIEQLCLNHGDTPQCILATFYARLVPGWLASSLSRPNIGGTVTSEWRRDGECLLAASAPAERERVAGQSVDLVPQQDLKLALC